MNAPLDAATLQGFGTACLIGALIGLEREKHRRTEDDFGSPGLRTFILVAEIGGIAGWLANALSAPWIIGVALGAVALGVVAGYVVAGRNETAGLGLTTEFAALVVCLLGAIATLGQSPLAIGLGVLTAAVLAYKQSLHGLVARLGWDDVYAGVRLLIAAFIVLPLLPDRPIDPWGALNPASLWRLVLLISGLSLVGYVATRWLGERMGTALTGVTGGLVSSTAVTLSFARQSRENGTTRRGLGPRGRHPALMGRHVRPRRRARVHREPGADSPVCSCRSLRWRRPRPRGRYGHSAARPEAARGTGDVPLNESIQPDRSGEVRGVLRGGRSWS